MQQRTVGMNRDNLPAVRVPASTSNLGSGFDCVGLALDIWLHAEIVVGEGDPVYSGAMEGFDPERDYAAQEIVDILPPGYQLSMRSDIPVCRGLGSSAAAIVAGRSLSMLIAEGHVDYERVFEHANDMEGHPDNAGPAVYGGLFLSADSPRKLRFHSELGVAVAIPEQTLSTHEARDILPSQLSRGDTISQASRSAALLLGLTNGDGDLIRQGMVDHIAVPVRKPLIKGYDEAVQAALETGAFGATISGAGTTIVAICPKGSAEPVARAMESAFKRSGSPAYGLCPDVAETGLEVLGGSVST